MTMRRILGLIMLAAALMFGAADMWHSVVPTYGAQDVSMGSLWLLISTRSLNAVQALITQHFGSPIWNSGIWPILVAPAWCVCAVLGFLFFVFGRRSAADR